MELTLECLLAKMDAKQTKACVTLKELKAGQQQLKEEIVVG
jgi:hypothetical protein